MEMRLQCLLVVIVACCISYIRSNESLEIKNCLPPNIKKQVSSGLSYFIADTRVEIPCIARGDGKLTYTWLKNGEVLDLNSPDIMDRAAMSSGVGTLSITAQVVDEGLYQCSVTNECGTSLSHKTMLILAHMVPFPVKDRPTEFKRVQGSSLILTCNPPESVPKAKITWILADLQVNEINFDFPDENPGFSTVPLDRRVTTDYDGNLYITSIRKEDEHGSKLYVCQAENTFTRSTNRGDDKKIIVHNSLVSDMGVELLWHSDTETLVLEGKNAKFKCIFSGQPEPTISWSKVTGNYDRNRVTFEHHEMIISDVQYEDAGEYKCMARNQLSKEFKTHTFTLSVEAAPVWRVKPREVTVGVEESAVFECNANGRPAPTVQWFINGRRYEDIVPNPRRVLTENTLAFTNLENDDSQVIQCNASNIHGSIWSDVYLYVQAIRPVIEVKLQEETVVSEEQNLRLPCLVSGKPNPRVYWYKSDQQLLFGKHEVQDNGDLLIKNTEKKDSGIYKCVAENIFGTATATGKLMVRGRTRIESKPVTQNVDYTNPVTFTCGATTDQMESANLRIHWLKDGVQIKSNERVVIEGGVLTITETNSKDTANYTCLAENGVDNDTATAILSVKAVPDPPYNVILKDCQARSATIEWKFDEKMSNFELMVKYIVEVSTGYTSEVWTEVISTLYPNSKATIDLSPYARYWFRVRAVNLMGTGEPSLSTPSPCETPMAVPDKNPDNVHTDESSTGFLVIKWDALEQIDQNGPGFRYVVEVQEQGTEGVQQLEVTDYRVREKVIPVNNIFRPYLIKVRSRNQIGQAARDPVTVIGYSGEAEPLVVPNNFELDPDVNVTSTSAGFRWDPVDESPEVIRGEFSGYKIRYWKTGHKETTLHEHIVQTKPNDGVRNRRDNGNNKIRGLIANLPSFSEINADVVVINKNFESNGSNVVNFSTPEGVPRRVQFLEALYRGSHHFLLQWGKPQEPNGIVTGYRISYRKISRLDVGPEIIAFDDLGPDDDQVNLKNLDPDSQYRIYIQARTAQGLGEAFFIDVQTINVVSYVVLPVIQHVSPGENEANVTWEIPAQKGSRFGQLYYIEYMRKNSNEWVRFQQPVEGQTWSILKHLEPGTQYQVRVVALSHTQGDEQLGESYTFMTAGIGAAKANFFSATWFIGMMVAISVLILILIIVCVIKRNRGDNYPVQEKERLRGAYNDDNQEPFNGYGKGDENGIKGSGSFDQDAEKVPLDEETDSLDYGDDDGSKFNEDGSFIGQYGRGEKENETNASSIV